MNKKNNKGFTLVELLAVIVILSVLISFAFLAVKPRTRNAKKSLLVADAKSYMKAAKEAYTLEEVEGEIVCHNLSDLSSYIKKDDNDYTGTIVSEFTDGLSRQTISITNGKYYIFATDNVSKKDLSSEMPAGFISSCTVISDQIPEDMGSSTLAYKLIMNEGGGSLTENLALIDERTSKVNFNDIETNPDKSGLYKAEDDDGMSYYYRGVVNNNWVSFGGFYWRIIRINGDGTIRLLFSGLASSDHTGSNSGIRNSKNAATSTYMDKTTYKVNNADISGLTSSVIQTSYYNGRFGTTYVGYMYNPAKVLKTYLDLEISNNKKVNTFSNYTNINKTKSDYYFFKNFDMTNDCFVGNNDDETGVCTLKCRELGVDCVASVWSTLATATGNYSTTAVGIYPATNPTNYIYTGEYKYTCWGNATPVTKANSDGTTSVYISCPLVTEIIGTVKDQPTYARVKFHGLFSDTLDASNSNVVDSNIKKELDWWYQNNIVNKKDGDNLYDLESYIADEIFCNDRTSSYNVNHFTTSGGNYLFSSYTRNVTNKNPSYKCPNKERDAFTLSLTSNQSSVAPKDVGNKLLKYPIGLLTMDEAVYAGGKYNTQNKDYWLYTGVAYSTMSPYGFFTSSGISNVWYIKNDTGGINGGNPISTFAVRPVINLKSDVVYVSGSGTETDPYIITL